MAYGEFESARDWWRHVAPKGQTRDLNTLRAHYLENFDVWTQAVDKWLLLGVYFEYDNKINIGLYRLVGPTVLWQHNTLFWVLFSKPTVYTVISCLH